MAKCRAYDLDSLWRASVRRRGERSLAAHHTSPPADHDVQQATHEAGALCILAKRHLPKGAPEVPATVLAAVTALLDAEADSTSPCEECEGCVKGGAQCKRKVNRASGTRNATLAEQGADLVGRCFKVCPGNHHAAAVKGPRMLNVFNILNRLELFFRAQFSLVS